MNQEKNRVSKLHGIDSEETLKKHKFIVDLCAKRINPVYVWTKELGEIATNLIYYFNGNEHVYDLNKSIAITGNYGSGKSMLMNVFREYNKLISNPNPNLYMIISTEDMVSVMSRQDFIESKILMFKNEFTDMCNPINILVNEFGFDYRGKSFGTDYKELFEMFLMKRYDIFQSFGKLTHVTMNIDTDDMKDMFSERIIDRFKEMFNIISLTGKSFRK